jgi:heterotetrameric sarcosine oxidase gamma subunit
VPELRLHQTSPLGGDALSRWATPGALTVTERTGLTLALITVRRGMRDACIDKLRMSYDLAAPTTAKIVQGERLSLSWAGPDSWLAIAADWPNLESDLKAALGDAASVVDLSDARIILRVAGSKASALLAKGVSIDLHPGVFKPGDTAMTLLAHVTAQLWLVDDSPAFDVAVPRATIHDVVHWLTASAGEFGVDAVDTARGGG